LKGLKEDTEMTKQVTLMVNDKPIELDYFVQSFIDHTVRGMLSSLEGVGELKSANISIDGSKVAINLNNAVLPTNPFVQKIVKSVVVGMVSTLKGVTDTSKVKVTTLTK